MAGHDPEPYPGLEAYLEARRAKFAALREAGAYAEIDQLEQEQTERLDAFFFAYKTETNPLSDQADASVHTTARNNFQGSKL